MLHCAWTGKFFSVLNKLQVTCFIHAVTPPQDELCRKLFFNSPVMSLRVKYKNSSATLTAENGIHKGSRGRLLTLCFLDD